MCLCRRCFPTQNSMVNNYEDFGMIDQLADDGPLYVYCTAEDF